MARPVVLGVVGDSGAGKTTLTRGLIRVMGDEQVARINADDYHRYERVERQQLGIAPLHPDANHLDVLTQHLWHLRRGEAGVVDQIDLPGDDARRLMELGFLPGARVTAGLSAPGGDPKVFQVDGAEIALRGETARRMKIRRSRN